MANLKLINGRIQHKIDTATNWQLNNIVLLSGEMGYESDTHKVKIGDGTTAWKDLPYVSPTKTSDLTNDSGFLTEDSLPDLSSAIDLGWYEHGDVNTVLNKITSEHKTESGTYKAIVSRYGHDDILYIDYYYNDNSNNAFREYANAIIHSIGSSNKTYYYTWENLGTADGNFVWKLNSDSGTVASQAATAFKDASVSGNTLTFTKNDGTTKDITLPGSSSIVDLGIFQNGTSNIILGTIINSYKTQSGDYKAIVSVNGYETLWMIHYFYNDSNNMNSQEYANAIIETIGSPSYTSYYSWNSSTNTWTAVSHSNVVSSQAKQSFKDASINGNILTFTKNDGTTKDITLPTTDSVTNDNITITSKYTHNINLLNQNYDEGINTNILTLIEIPTPEKLTAIELAKYLSTNGPINITTTINGVTGEGSLAATYRPANADAGMIEEAYMTYDGSQGYLYGDAIEGYWLIESDDIDIDGGLTLNNKIIYSIGTSDDFNLNDDSQLPTTKAITKIIENSNPFKEYRMQNMPGTEWVRLVQITDVKKNASGTFHITCEALKKDYSKIALTQSIFTATCGINGSQVFVSDILPISHTPAKTLIGGGVGSGGYVGSTEDFGSGGDYGSDGSDASSYAVEDAATLDNETTLINEIREDLASTVSEDEGAAVSSDSGDMGSGGGPGSGSDMGSGAGSGSIGYGLNSLCFEEYDGETYLCGLMHYPSVDLYDSLIVNIKIENNLNYTLLDDLQKVDLSQVNDLEVQLFEGTEFVADKEYAIQLTGKVSDYVSATDSYAPLGFFAWMTDVDSPPIQLVSNTSIFLVVTPSGSTHYESRYPYNVCIESEDSLVNPKMSIDGIAYLWDYCVPGAITTNSYISEWISMSGTVSCNPYEGESFNEHFCIQINDVVLNKENNWTAYISNITPAFTWKAYDDMNESLTTSDLYGYGDLNFTFDLENTYYQIEINNIKFTENNILNYYDLSGNVFNLSPRLVQRFKHNVTKSYALCSVYDSIEELYNTTSVVAEVANMALSTANNTDWKIDELADRVSQLESNNDNNGDSGSNDNNDNSGNNNNNQSTESIDYESLNKIASSYTMREIPASFLRNNKNIYYGEYPFTTKVGSYAFAGCTSLKYLAFTSDSLHFDNYVFGSYNDPNLYVDTLQLPKNTNYKGIYYSSQIQAENLYYNGTLAEWLELSSINQEQLYYNNLYIKNNDNDSWEQILSGDILELPPIQTIPSRYVFHDFWENNFKVLKISNQTTAIDSNAIYMTHVFIPETTTDVGVNALYNVDCLLCEAESKPSTWSYSIQTWQHVFWGCDRIDPYVASDGNSIIGFKEYQAYVNEANIDFNGQDCNLRDVFSSWFINNYNTFYIAYIQGSINTTSLTVPPCLIISNWKQLTGLQETLQTIIFEDGCTIVPEEICEQCSQLTSVSLPNSIEKIDHSAFGECYSLTNINIPDSVQTLGRYVFYNTSIEKLNTKQATEIYTCFSQMPNLKQIIVPNATRIDKYNFYGVPMLEYADLYKAEEIGIASNELPNFTTLIIRTPSVCEMTSSSLDLNNLPLLQVYVPDELVEQYKVKTNWIILADRIKPLSSYTGGTYA